MGRGGIEVEVQFLYVFAVISLEVCEAEEAFFQYGVAAIPEGQREAEPAFPVGDAEDAVLAPAVCAASCVVVREVFPAVAIRGVVFADGCPFSFGEVGSPSFPVFFSPVIFSEASGLRIDCFDIFHNVSPRMGGGIMAVYTKGQGSPRSQKSLRRCHRATLSFQSAVARQVFSPTSFRLDPFTLVERNGKAK